MTLSKDEVKAIADYARIALDEEELEEMCAYMNDAVHLLEPIVDYELEGVEPTFHPIGGLTNVMGQDSIDSSCRTLSLDDALKGAASTVDRSFRVPSILGEMGGDR